MKIQKQDETNQIILQIRSALEISNKVLKNTEELVAALQEENFELKPKAEYYDSLIDSDNSQLGRNNLIAKLKFLGILNKDKTPRQDLVPKYFKVKIKTTPIGPKSVTFVTPKGLEFLRRKLNEYFTTENGEDKAIVGRTQQVLEDFSH